MQLLVEMPLSLQFIPVVAVMATPLLPTFFLSALIKLCTKKLLPVPAPPVKVARCWKLIWIKLQ